MKFEDIKICGNQIYMLRTLDLKAIDIEQAVKSFNYEAYKEKDYDVEKSAIPSFAAIFYTYLFLYQHIPTPEKFVSYYFTSYADIIKELNADFVECNGKKLSRAGIIGRVVRALQSLIREYHFYLMLYEDAQFDKATYSFKDDMNGVDIKADYSGIVYNISIFLGTKNSIECKTVKNTIRHNYTNEIRVPLDMKHCLVCGDTYLYSKDYLTMVYNEAGILS